MFKGLTSRLSLWCLATLTVLGLASSARAFEDVATGRWMTRDPAGYVDGMNVYQCSNSNAVNWIDPTGTVCKVGCGPHECGCESSHDPAGSPQPAPPPGGGGTGTTTRPPTSGPASQPAGTQPAREGPYAQCLSSKAAAESGGKNETYRSTLTRHECLAPRVECLSDKECTDIDGKTMHFCRFSESGIQCCGKVDVAAVAHELIHALQRCPGAEVNPITHPAAALFHRVACLEVQAYLCSHWCATAPDEMKCVVDQCAQSVADACNQPTAGTRCRALDKNRDNKISADEARDVCQQAAERSNCKNCSKL
jgi:hypothetical protein